MAIVTPIAAKSSGSIGNGSATVVVVVVDVGSRGSVVNQ